MPDSLSPRRRRSRTLAATGCAVALVLVAGCSASGRQPASDRGESSATSAAALPARSSPASASAGAGATGAVVATPSPGPDATSALKSAPIAPSKPLTLDTERVLAHARAFERLGPRPLGSVAERRAAEFVEAELRRLGYEVTVETFPVPGGTSRNVIARAPGSDPRVIVLGAHLDSKSNTPGINDDALGCAILLEIARHAAIRPATPTLEFDFFGAEEYDAGPHRDHHRGSRYRVSRMTKSARAGTAGMIAVDVVGYGPRLHVRTMQRGNRLMSDLLLARARELAVPLTYLKDPGPTGWADHEAFEKAWIPSAWLERLDDPAYHSPKDTTAHLQPARVRESGQFVLDVVYGLDGGDLDRLSGPARFQRMRGAVSP